MEQKKKKPYTKPTIVIEHFEMTQSISNCEVRANFNKGDCGADYYRPNAFNYSTYACEYKTSDGFLDGLCYSTWSDTFNVFNS